MKPLLMVLIVGAFGVPVSAAAQEVAGSFDQLRVLIRPGETITVTTDDGSRVTGKITEMSATALALSIDREQRRFTAASIDTISQRRPDSLSNGAKIGFGVGGVLGFLAGLAVLGQDVGGHPAAVLPVATAIYGGLGAAVGVAFDAMVTSDQVIFARPKKSAARFSMAPMKEARRTGIRVAIAF